MKMVVRCHDDLVSADHPVRTVWALVATMDLSAFCEPIRAREGLVGRDATDPALLVSLWLYGAIRGVGSARELDRLCRESAPFRWLVADVGVNHHLLSDFRVNHAGALDGLFTRSIAALVDKGLVKVRRISQDGVRVRVGAGASSFRSEGRLNDLLEKARLHVEELRRRIEDPGHSAAVGAAKQAARMRAATDKAARLQEAIAQLPGLKEKQETAAKKAGNGARGQKIRGKQLRVSTTDPEARVMHMPNGGFNPAVNVQLASDTESRAILAVEVSNEGSDSAGLSEPLRQQTEQRSGRKVSQHLLDGGYVRIDDLERAHAGNVEVFMPSKTARNKKNRGLELAPKPGDSEAILAWKARMSGAEGKTIYKQRASTSETINADLRCRRGLTQLAVRGLRKIRCVALWCAMAYNVMHFARALLA